MQSHRALEPGQVSWEASRTNALADLADRMGKTPSRGATVSLGQRAPSQAPRARPRGSVGGGCFLFMLVPPPQGSKETVELSGGVSRALARSPQI